MNAELTQQELKDFLHYNPETGHFTYNYWYRGVQKGTIAGSMRPDGYLSIQIKGKTYRLHRLAFLWVDGSFPREEMQVDHINGNRADNRYNNLRLCNRNQNCHNSKKYVTNTSGVKGVSKNRKGTYRISIEAHGNIINQTCATLQQAEEVIYNLRSNLHKEFANHGK